MALIQVQVVIVLRIRWKDSYAALASCRRMTGSTDITSPVAVKDMEPEVEKRALCAVGVELMRQTKDANDLFFDIPIRVSEDLVREFADAIKQILQGYPTFVAYCCSSSTSEDNHITFGVSSQRHHHQPFSRSALLMEVPGNYWRLLAADIEGRQRLVSEKLCLEHFSRY